MNANAVTARDLVADNVQLFSLPEVCLQVQALVNDPAASMEMIGKVVRQDAALTAQLLRIVNSAYYGFRSRIDTLTRALSIVGTTELLDLTLALSVIEVFNRIPNDLVDMVTFWRHGVFTGLLSQKIAEKCNVLHGERLFIAGLLHDIGKLVIYYHYPEDAARILAEQKSGEREICQIEEEILGMHHAAVGGELLSQWQLPQTLVDAAAFHHAPEQCDDAALEVAIVHVANVLTNHLETLAQASTSQYYDPYALFLSIDEEATSVKLDELNISRVAWNTTGLSYECVADLIQGASTGFEEVLQTLYPV